MEQDREGIIDDIGTLVEWRPVLALVRDVQAAKDLPAQADAVRALVAFVLKTGFGKNPYDTRWFLIFTQACVTVRNDPTWRKIVADLLK